LRSGPVRAPATKVIGGPAGGSNVVPITRGRKTLH
jgi:hypothetical protein